MFTANMRVDQTANFDRQEDQIMTPRRTHSDKGTHSRQNRIEILEPRRLLSGLPQSDPILFPNNQRALAAAEKVDLSAISTGQYGMTPLSFEANHGQTDPSVQFFSRGNGYSVFLQSGGTATLSLSKADGSGAALRLRLLGADTGSLANALDPLGTRSNYFNGDDPSQWTTNILNFGKVRYSDVYPGIDAVYYGRQHQLEYDFIVAPGGDPGQIRTAFDGADSLKLDPDGNLIVQLGSRHLLFNRPDVYQMIGGVRRQIGASFEIAPGGSDVGFRIDKYDATATLVIDPVLGYSTYLGGNGYDRANAVAVDSSGNAYITGVTGALDFPTTPGAYLTTRGGSQDGFVTKLNASGSGLIYSTFVRGAYANDIAVDASGAAYITGYAGAGFVTTPGAFTTPQWGFDTFVTKLNPQGNALVYSSRFGGSFDDFGNGIAVDSAGNAVITGTTFNAQPQADFPVLNAFQPTYGGGTNDAFVSKLNASGSALVFSTFLGGGRQSLNENADWGQGVALDPAGNIYVTGYTYSPDFPTTPGVLRPTGGFGLDGFVTKFTPTGTIAYSTFVGGSQHDEVWAIAVDTAGNAYITGNTDGSWPTTPGAYQTNNVFHNFSAFVSKINPAGSAFVYSTYVDDPVNEDWERGWDIAVDAAGQAVIVGDTDGAALPTANAVQPNYGGGLQDAFVTRLNSAGSALIYSTFLGGNGFDQAFGVALDGAGNALIAGQTSSFNYPTTPGAFSQTNGAGTEHHDDAFITKIANAAQSPAVVSDQFIFDGFTLPDAPHRLTYTFSTDVSASLGTNDLILENRTIGSTVSATNFALSYNTATRTATFTFPGYPRGILPDGQYRATLRATGVTDPQGHPLPADVVTTFFFNDGDANRDRTVNLLDFNILASHFGQSGQSFSQGDFNYDGTVNLLDFNILASKFGSSVGPQAFSNDRIGTGGAVDGRTRDSILAELIG
jgi:hypothetical protein